MNTLRKDPLLKLSEIMETIRAKALQRMDEIYKQVHTSRQLRSPSVEDWVSYPSLTFIPFHSHFLVSSTLLFSFFLQLHLRFSV